MPGQIPKPVGWRSQVAAWFQLVAQYRSWSGTPYPAAAAQYQQSFPPNVVLRAVSQLFRALAVWIVRGAIRDAAAAMGTALDPVVLDLLTDLAVGLL